LSQVLKILQLEKPIAEISLIKRRFEDQDLPQLLEGAGAHHGTQTLGFAGGDSHNLLDTNLCKLLYE